MRKAVIGKRPGGSQLPGALSRAMPARGGKNEVGTKGPPKSGLACIWPGHDKQVEQLGVPESGPGLCAFSQRLGYDLKSGANDLFEIQWPVGAETARMPQRIKVLSWALVPYSLGVYSFLI